MANLRQITQSGHHFWQGRPGLWRSLLPAREARQIAAAHPTVFSELNYSCTADADLSRDRADTNWIALVGPDLAQQLQAVTPLQQRVNGLEEQLHETQARLAASEQSLLEATANLDRTILPDDTQPKLGPLALRVAYFLHNFSARHPRSYRLLNQFLGLAASVHRRSNAFVRRTRQPFPSGRLQVSPAWSSWLAGWARMRRVHKPSSLRQEVQEERTARNWFGRSLAPSCNEQ